MVDYGENSGKWFRVIVKLAIAGKTIIYLRILTRGK
jgi:hypothetical protein